MFTPFHSSFQLKREKKCGIAVVRSMRWIPNQQLGFAFSDMFLPTIEIHATIFFGDVNGKVKSPSH
jgi:hypothetical protein